ncbi:MAG: NlpC/P60 family protein [Actinomycetota bacterium]|nr:NlpC/P60 family protein [Actinomycetota bacterium]
MVFAALVTAPAAAAEPGAIAAKRAQANQVLAEIQHIDANMERAIEAYNAANARLQQIEGDLKKNRGHLAVAKASLRHAQTILSKRIVAIYTSRGGTSTIDVLLGARSLDDLLSRIDTANRISSQDARIAQQIKVARSEIQRHGAQLKRMRSEQARLVSERAAHKASIERQLAQRRQLLSAVRGEIERLQAQERARQAELARQAEARLAAQRRDEARAAAVAEAVAPPVLEPAAPTPEVVAAPPPPAHGGVVGIAMQYLGVPYKWGGASPSTGFDCSGFVMYVFAKVGVSLPHGTYAQYAMGSPVSRGELQPGDVVFFNGLGHNGIYIGGGQMIHSPHTGDVVKISSLTGWYASTYVGARRY